MSNISSLSEAENAVQGNTVRYFKHEIIIPGDPRTKKNSLRIVKLGKFHKVLPSKAFIDYQKDCGLYLAKCPKGLSGRYNAKCVYYMKTERKVDLSNLIEATMDILVEYGVIADDNSKIIVSHDGSRVFCDKANPRVEITIEEVQFYNGI